MLVLLVTLLFGYVSAQTCASGGSVGPCLNGLCGSGSTCLSASNICCLNAYIVTTTTSAPCVDLVNPNTGVSDCPKMASYCNNSIYYTLMTQQCPKTCGRCSGSSATTTASTCVDLVNPNTGVSDCPRMASYCNNSAYYTLMTQQCPKTCGRCTSG